MQKNISLGFTSWIPRSKQLSGMEWGITSVLSASGESLNSSCKVCQLQRWEKNRL